MPTMKSFHVPLLPSTHQQLRIVSAQLKKPATELVRSAILEWLKEQEQKIVHESIVNFALECGGTEFDLDSCLPPLTNAN